MTSSACLDSVNALNSALAAFYNKLIPSSDPTSGIATITPKFKLQRIISPTYQLLTNITELNNALNAYTAVKQDGSIMAYYIIMLEYLMALEADLVHPSCLGKAPVTWLGEILNLLNSVKFTLSEPSVIPYLAAELPSLLEVIIALISPLLPTYLSNTLAFQAIILEIAINIKKMTTIIITVALNNCQ